MGANLLLLLLMANEKQIGMKNVLPTKLFEYIRSRIPILAIIPQDGEARLFALTALIINAIKMTSVQERLVVRVV